MNKRVAFPLCSSITLSLLLASSLLGQVSETGLPAYGTFHGGGVDGVSLRNGNLHIEIPIVSVPERSSPNWGYKFVYDMPSWEIDLTHPTPTTSKWNVWPVGSELANWNLLTDANTAVWMSHDIVQDSCTYSDVNGQHTVQYQVSTNYYMVDSHGTRHPFELRSLSIPQGCGGITGSQTSGVALDGSGITMNTNGNVSFPDNDGPFNGNQQETLGRTVLSTFTSQPDSNGNFYTLWTAHDSNGNPQQFRVDYSPGTGQTSFCSVAGLGSNCYEYSNHRNFPQKLTLPTGGAYVFTWSTDGNADLLRIDLPSGGYISYGYQSYSWISAQHRLTQHMARRRVTSRTVSDGQTANTWTYTCNGSSLGCTVRDPLSNDEVHVFDTTAGAETQVKWYQGTATSGTLLRTVNKDYSYEMSSTQPDAISHGAINVRQIRATTILEDGSQRKTETDYELFQQQFASSTYTFTVTRLNPTEFREYDYGPTAPGALLKRTDYTYLHTNNQNYISRNIVRNVLTKTVFDGTGAQGAQTVNEYDNYSHPGLPMLASNAVQHNSSYNTSFIYRGNITAVSQWLKTTNTFVASTNQFDDAGNVVSTTDPLGNKTGFDYTDSWSNSACAPSGQGKAYVTKITNALNQVTTKTYNSCTGSLASTTDLNLQVVSTTFDMMGRTTQVSYPDGGSTKYCYTDVGGSECSQSGPPFSVVVTNRINSILINQVSTPVNKISTLLFDGLGRVSETQVNSDPDGVTYTDTTYDAFGRKYQEYNPTRCSAPPTTNCGSETTWGFSTYAYDALGRVSSVARPDGSAVTTSYSGNQTTVTDEIGNQRTSQFDGLGRITNVWEAPNNTGYNFQTLYSYDALNNLTGVTQNGSNSSNARVRTFVYDTLGRLTSATNPESGTVLYAYDAEGNVITKTAPMPNHSSGTVQTTYTHDALNRMIKKSYNDGTTAPVQYGFDAVALTGCTTTPPSLTDPYPLGRRTAMCDGSGATSWSHETMGRPAVLERTIGGATRSASYQYNLGGSLATETIFSGKQLQYTYSLPGQTISAGRVISVTDPSNTPVFNFVTGGKYAPNGALATAVYGAVSGGFSGFTETDVYSSRLQPILRFASSSAGTTLNLCYDFHLKIALTSPCSFPAGSGDNGNVFQIVNGHDSTRTQNFTYDKLNRITSAYTTSSLWGATYVIDAWGNLTNMNLMSGKTNANPQSLQASPASINNQLTGLCEDAAGNTVFYTPCPTPPWSMTTDIYDAENRLKTAFGATYIYDGDGNRVEKKFSDGTGTIYWRESDGTLTNETDTSNVTLHRHVYFDGRRVCRTDTQPTTTQHFYFSDHLGSANVVASGTDGSIEEDSDFYPYGGELVFTNNVPQNYKFTGKERDPESSLDNFGARYYASSMGRFMTPDWAAKATAVPYASFGDPQTLNLYGYVRNNPLSKVDPDGHCSAPSVGKGQVGVCIDLYIQAKTINGVGKGDNRGPAPNDPNATHRVEIQLAIDVKTGLPSIIKNDPGTSEALGGLLSGKGSSQSSVSDPVKDDAGTSHFTLDNTAENGLSFLPFAPKDTIKTSLNIDVTADGKVGVEGGVRTAYPSLEMYSYDPNGKATTILQITEHKPSDLANQNQQVPTVAPQ